VPRPARSSLFARPVRMPEELRHALSKRELRDLVEFLSSLK
jgi:hypothetical protein